MKAGFPLPSIWDMRLAEAEMYISIIEELMSGAGRTKKYVVKRDGKKAPTKRKNR